MQAIEMQVQITGKNEVLLKLPDNIKQKSVKVIVLYDVVQKSVQKKRKFGQFKDTIQISDDFDDALADKFWIGKSS